MVSDRIFDDGTTAAAAAEDAELQLTRLYPRGAPAQPQMIPYGGLGNATMTTHHIRRIIPAARSE